MKNNPTYKDVIQGIEDWCGANPTVNDFGFGDIADIHTKEHNFPMIWLQPDNSYTNGVKSTTKFQMYILDILEQDKSNLKDVMSNTMIIGNTAVAEFWEDEAEELGFELDESSVSLIPFEGKFDQLLGSWIFNITLHSKVSLNPCS